MSKKIKYTDEPIGDVKVLKDFLPSPEEIILKDDSVKVTLILSKTCIEFFKSVAKNHKYPYQKLIRKVLDEYSSQYQK